VESVFLSIGKVQVRVCFYGVTGHALACWGKWPIRCHRRQKGKSGRSRKST